jgi:hypothetical protein
MAPFHRVTFRHARAAGILAALAGLQMAPLAHAQLDLGRIIRQSLTPSRLVPGAVPRPPSPGQPAGYDAQQCNKAANWLAADVAMLPPEFAENGRFGTVAGRPAENRINYRPRKTGPLGDVVPSGIPRDNWLLEDSRFIPHFGKPYDQMSDAELAELQKTGIACRMMGRTANGVMVDMAVYSRVFAPGIFPTYAKGVQTIRAARREVRDAADLFASLPATDDGYQTYLNMADNAPRLRGFMSASELEAFNSAMEAANGRVARPALDRLAQQQIASAQGCEGLVAVSKLIVDMTGDERNSPMHNDPTVKALKAKQDDIARELHRAERARIDALGCGLVGLERGVAYSNEIEPRYRKYIHIASINELWEEFLRKRHAMIEASRPELSSRIGQTWDESGLAALVSRYIPFGKDQQTAAGTALLTRVAEQKDEIEKRRVLGANHAGGAPAKNGAIVKASASAKSGGAIKATKAVAAAEPDDESEEPLAKGEPSESVMYDLIKNHFDSQAARINAANEACANGPSGNDVFGAVACLGVMATKGGAVARRSRSPVSKSSDATAPVASLASSAIT